ncbi:MAG: hypothetical protein LH614_20000 [Pyrinomonadaceae bacterium]|nr:hypothetical protein [Pyrinomonadaceae bacterium]
MKLFEGKSPAERNKIIAASVLGVMALLALTYTFGGSLFGGRKVSVTVSASPTPTASPRRTSYTAALPTTEEENFQYTTTPVNYTPSSFYAPDAGRNIFAFYEPPPPTPYSPTPVPPQKPVEIPTPTQTPVPPLLVGFVTPQSVFAGSKTFRLEVNGDKFTPESLIFLNGNQLPTTFISPQKLVADVPSNFIAGAGAIQILVRTADGGLYSNQVSLNVQAPPVPQFQYIGMIARQRYNNDTAYFQEQGKPLPLGARLNDVVGGRFRLMSISASETIFEDVNLGFKHRLALYRPTVGQSAGSNPVQNQDPTLISPGRFPNKGGFNPNNPNSPNISTPYNVQPGEIPGIPGNIPIYNPTPPPNKDDEDDDKDGDG